MHHFLILLCFVFSVLAQPPVSRLEGTVEDPSGGAVIGARITAENRQTGHKATAFSDGRGFYIFLSLPPGSYSVTTEAAGFRRAELSGLVLDVSSTITAPIHLELGATSETVNVVARETPVQLADAQGGGVVAPSEIDLLPQQERNPMKLAIFQPGVQVTAGSVGLSHVNGARQGSNEVKLDGIDISEPISPALGYSTPVPSDLVEEFRVITYSAKAEYAGTAGPRLRSSAGRGPTNSTVASLSTCETPLSTPTTSSITKSPSRGRSSSTMLSARRSAAPYGRTAHSSSLATRDTVSSKRRPGTRLC